MKSIYKIIRILTILIPFGILTPKIIENKKKSIGGNNGIEIPILEIISIAFFIIIVLFLLIETRNKKKLQFNFLLVFIGATLYVLFLNYFNLLK